MFSLNNPSSLHDIQCSQDYLLDQHESNNNEITNFHFENLIEKPPLTAIGEVIELIGHEWDSNDCWRNGGTLNNIQQNACHFCALPIQEQFLLKVKHKFIFGPFQCGGCHLGISPNEMVYKLKLDVLNQIFSSTPKPSKHARAKLALETGLSMRVIQVWFQNRRSKERRLKHLCNFLRHYEQQGLPPPPFNINPEDGSVIPASGAFSPGCFSLDDSSFIYDDETAELSS
uniref:Homeobox domain-containing protein n=1 Tax=Panagrolaimus sp. ES5 TaxID=591445 RepID=A0AC34FIX0_9BILA